MLRNRSVEQEIIAIERIALDGWSHGSSQGYMDIAADDVTLFDFLPGAQLRIEGLEAFRNHMFPIAEQVPPHAYEIMNPKVQVYDDTAILIYHWNALTTDGKPLPSWKATSVYHWKEGKWSMVHTHWSPVQGA